MVPEAATDLYLELAHAYAGRGNAEAARFMLRKTGSQDRRRINELLRASGPDRVETELRYAALEGMPGRFEELAHPGHELSDLCYEHALFRWYADRDEGRVTLDLPVPIEAQKSLLLARLGLDREAENRLDEFAECIADDWRDSMDRLDPFELTLESYLTQEGFGPRPCERTHRAT